MASTARGAALRFLKIRPRSTEELKEKLVLKNFSFDEIEKVVQDLLASGLLDDRAFTKSWINYRLARPFGFRRIVLELKAKGVDQEIIDGALEDLGPEYNPQAIILDLAQRRWQRLPDLDPLKKKKRVMDFLLRRGFELDGVMNVMKQLK